MEMSLSNLSESEDTQLLQKALHQIKSHSAAVIDIHHAGPDLRFLTAFLSSKIGDWVLTGSSRIRERPVAPLVKALLELGAGITYLEKEGFPPLGIQGKVLKGGRISIDSSISSQFISALLLIAPTLEHGLELSLTGSGVSFPYVRMTLELLKEFGASVHHSGNTNRVSASVLHIPHSPYIIESDWSSASYWYSICALSGQAEIELLHLSGQSLQADSILPSLFENLGVKTMFKKNSILLTSKKPELHQLDYDFTECPDLAQTLALTCFGLGIEARLSGLKTLKIKETDRILALKTELEKFGAVIHATADALHIERRKPETRNQEPEIITVATYNDHRMAMSFAPLALVYSRIRIDDPAVVDKSYPGFWEDLKSAGFNVNLQP